MKKFYSCARLAVASAGRGATVLHGNSGRIGRVGGGPGDTCIAFFRYWTENFCQVDGGGRVLWPQGRTVGEVFSTTFQDWLAQQNSPESVVSGGKVSLSTFWNALADPEFAHVKMRKEHHHVRCDKYVSFLMNVVDVFIILWRAGARHCRNKLTQGLKTMQRFLLTWSARSPTRQWSRTSGGSRSIGWARRGIHPQMCICSSTTTPLLF